ncbi:hypothetical protein LOTGIDRAFT_156685 [Lottia gigantea]|uniref:Fibronectin type-III domain-containing protein n=1 Tax=Lottia gigantea TaxID=225164 RepID=V4AIW8_LOTGI|nr:hypothetical protein LOTGIDRAFT_156685 [Lottia gigantea]ESP04074.1 hypothetical protein LOTGIDRAFT_156685 [Lottia gigantea]
MGLGNKIPETQDSLEILFIHVDKFVMIDILIFVNITVPYICLYVLRNKPQSAQKAITSQTKVQNCVRGCNIAIGLYEKMIEAEQGYLPRPELVRDSKQDTTVELKWDGLFLKNVTYLVHKKIIDYNKQGAWQLHNSVDFERDGTIYITNLHPYLTYKFKVIAVVSKFHILDSSESILITTRPNGAPESPPTITRVSALSPTVISISWKPPSFKNGPLLSYKLSLNPKGHPDLKEINKDIAGNVTSITVGKLQSSQSYRITLSAWNIDGEGPTAYSYTTTPNPGNFDPWAKISPY